MDNVVIGIEFHQADKVPKVLIYIVPKEAEQPKGSSEEQKPSHELDDPDDHEANRFPVLRTRQGVSDAEAANVLGNVR